MESYSKCGNDSRRYVGILSGSACGSRKPGSCLNEDLTPTILDMEYALNDEKVMEKEGENEDCPQEDLVNDYTQLEEN